MEHEDQMDPKYRKMMRPQDMPMAMHKAMPGPKSRPMAMPDEAPLGPMGARKKWKPKGRR